MFFLWGRDLCVARKGYVLPAESRSMHPDALIKSIDPRKKRFKAVSYSFIPVESWAMNEEGNISASSVHTPPHRQNYSVQNTDYFIPRNNLMGEKLL